MKNTFLKLVMAITLTLTPMVGFAGTAYAACPRDNTSKGQVIKGIGATGSNCDDRGVYRIISAAVRILSIAVGIIAVFAIINAGFKYITSGGDSGKVGAAKNTLIFALVGLAIAALAQFLVHFVLFQTEKAVPG